MNPESPAPAPVRFDCPACSAVLTVPSAAAGLQGPCPKCWQEIVSPDPARGLPARLPAPPPLATAPPAPATAPEPALPPEPALLPEPASLAEPASQPEPDLVPPIEPAEATASSEPEASPAPPALPVPAVARKSSGIGWWITSALLSATFAAVGFQLGKRQRQAETTVPLVTQDLPAPEVPAPEPPEPPEPVTPPAPETPPIPVEPVAPSAPSAPDRLTAEASLRAFLEAPDWKTRGERVLDPDVILPAMERYAAQAGDGPFATTSVRFSEKTGDIHLFKVCTPAIPEGFPVAVVETTEGPMIDWESFIGFHDDQFQHFIKGPSGRSGIFYLQIKPEPDAKDEAAAHFVRYRLSAPMPGREAVAWIPKESVALARLRAVFDGSGGIDKPTVEMLVAGDGVPVKLALEKKKSNDGREFIEIKDYVAFGWSPAGR